jgi:hypothetical protein
MQMGFVTERTASRVWPGPAFHREPIRITRLGWAGLTNWAQAASMLGKVKGRSDG